MKYLFLCIFSLLLFYKQVRAQELFVKAGVVTYEKKKSIPPEMKALNQEMFAGLNSTWRLTFTEESSLYKSLPIRDQAALNRELLNQNLKDEIYFDFAEKTRTRKKMIGKEGFLLKGNIPNLQWKLLPEVREIAGYECRKARTIINDSVTVVAFYTDRILLNGGPEGFNGLPGMILGLAIPQQKYTWFAVKVELSTENTKLSPPTEGRKVTLEELIEKMGGEGASGDLRLKQKFQEHKKQLEGFTL